MGYGAYHITIRLLLDEHAGDKERQHLQLARDLVTEVRALITDGQSPEGWPAIVNEVEVSPDIEPGYGVVPVQEQCATHSPNGPFSDFVCSLSKGHTKPVEHWDAGRGAMFFTPPDPLCGESDGQGHTCTQPVGHEGYHADTANGYRGPMFGREIPSTGFLNAVKEKVDVTYVLVDDVSPGDDEDDGSDYHKALDRHDNAQK